MDIGYKIECWDGNIRMQRWEKKNKSTLPNTKSIDPNTAIRSPKLIIITKIWI